MLRTLTYLRVMYLTYVRYYTVKSVIKTSVFCSFTLNAYKYTIVCSVNDTL